MYEETVEYGGISIKDLNCYDMIWKLAVVEQNSENIWTNIEKIFGFGFFNWQIELEFGINPATHENIAFDFAK